jgi:hypothetical protein
MLSPLPPAKAWHAGMYPVEGEPEGRPGQAYEVPGAGHTRSTTHVLHKQVRVIHLRGGGVKQHRRPVRG